MILSHQWKKTREEHFFLQYNTRLVSSLDFFSFHIVHSFHVRRVGCSTEREGKNISRNQQKSIFFFCFNCLAQRCKINKRNLPQYWRSKSISPSIVDRRHIHWLMSLGFHTYRSSKAWNDGEDKVRKIFIFLLGSFLRLKLYLSLHSLSL